MKDPWATNDPWGNENDLYDKFGVPKDINVPDPVYAKPAPKPVVEAKKPVEKKEGEEGEEGAEEEEEEEMVIEPYMTKDYYMPGYVDTTPQKEYPPHIA